MTAGSVTPLVARIDRSGVRCGKDVCAAVITRMVWRRGMQLAAFSGEWREGDDKVWRLTDYARHQRKRRESGSASSSGGWHPRNWSEPATWGLVVRARPCRVECPDCGETQLIA